MSNATDSDEVCVQAIHVELGGIPLKFSKNPLKH